MLPDPILRPAPLPLQTFSVRVSFVLSLQRNSLALHAFASRGCVWVTSWVQAPELGYARRRACYPPPNARRSRASVVSCVEATQSRQASHTQRAARMPVDADPHTVSEEVDGHSKVGKHSWTPEEDEKLTAAVTKYGACRWSMISMHVASGRVGKQCRERWNNHLCPDVKKSEWSDAEDLAILQGVADQGTRWCEIVQTAALAGRTDLSLIHI